MTMSDVCVVVPVFNEAESVGEVVADLRTAFPHVLCVDDGSRDGSAGIARAAGATVLRHAVNLGQGAALQTAFDFVGQKPEFTWIVTFDADGQHLRDDAARMVEEAREHDYDVVLASRFSGSTLDMPRLRRAVLRAAVTYTRRTTGLSVTDAHNGLRVMHRRVLPLVRLRQPRMAYASEFLNAVGRHRLRYAEVPTTVLYSDYSIAKGQRNINAVNILFDLAVARLRTFT